MFVQNTYFRIHVKEITFIEKAKGASVVIFSKSGLFSQIFVKDIGLRCRKFIIQNRAYTDQLLVTAYNV